MHTRAEPGLSFLSPWYFQGHYCSKDRVKKVNIFYTVKDNCIQINQKDFKLQKWELHYAISSGNWQQAERILT